MKKSLVLSCAFCVSLGAVAQNTIIVEAPPGFHRIEFGFRFMPTVSAFSLQNSDGGSVQGQATFGYGIGGLVGINFTNHMGVEVEAIYNDLSQKYADRDLSRKIDINYINFPLLLSFSTGKSRPVNLNFVAGPQIGYNVGSRIKTTGSNGQDTLRALVIVKKGDFGFAYGAGLEFALNETRTMRFDIGFRGVFGLIDIDQPPGGTDSNSYNVIDRSNIETYSAFAGLTLLF